MLVLILVGCAVNDSGTSRKMAEYYRASQSSAEAQGWSDAGPYTAGYKIIRERNHSEIEQCQTVKATVGLFGFPDFYMARSRRVFSHDYLKENQVSSFNSISSEQKNLVQLCTIFPQISSCLSHFSPLPFAWIFFRPVFYTTTVKCLAVGDWEF